MPTVIVKPAEALAVTLAEAKDNLRVTGSRMDAQVEVWIRGITKHAEGFMRRSLMRQDWQLTTDSFSQPLRLSRPPVLEIASVKYFDTDNVLQTVDPATYMLAGGRVALKPGASWPASYTRPDAVQITYTCGYGDTAAATPPDVKLYLLAKLAEQFDPASSEKLSVQSSFIDGLLDDYVDYANYE